MRKCVALVMTMLCLTALLVSPVLAAGTASPTTEDLTEATTETPGVTVTLGTKEVSEEVKETQEKEVEKLAEAESPKSYFGTVKDAEGKEVDVEELLESKELKVHELQPLAIDGYKKDMGDLTVDMTFATPYEKDVKVIVMIGFVTDAGVEWIALEGVGVESEDDATGTIQVVIPEEIAERIQNEQTLVAIVSK